MPPAPARTTTLPPVVEPDDETIWGVGATMLDEAGYWKDLWYGAQNPIDYCDNTDPGLAVYCESCLSDADCSGLGGGECRYFDSWEEDRCTVACDTSAECPVNWLCRYLPESTEQQYCVPAGEVWAEDVDYYKWRVTNMVENIEVIRGIYDLYGYMIF